MKTDRLSLPNGSTAMAAARREERSTNGQSQARPQTVPIDVKLP